MSEGSHRSARVGAGSVGVAVVTPRVVVVLPDGAPARVVEELWRVASDPSAVAESLVAALPLRGPDEVGSFAVLVHEDAGPDGVRLQIVLRGDAVVDADGGAADGPRRVDARGVVPFYLAALDRVRAYRVGHAAAPASVAVPGALPLVAGAVAADAVTWRLGGQVGADAASDDPGNVAAPAPAPAAPAAETALVDDAEAAARVRATSVPTAAIPVAPDEAVVRAVHAVRILRDRAVPGTETGDDDAERIPLDPPVIVGRRPRPPRVVRGAEPRLVTVPSPLGEISGTHVAIRQESGAIVVTDLGSTNGTAVLAPGADRLALRPGESLVVVPGTRVDIGDGVVLEILAAR
ncbi:FHA domain-containing protein [Clavibacter sp. Sh2088]|uniref:FHA domain-containing protein n=1 Tax=Clavibacter sp. Sh2088 TaxID=3397676 RepID=UPI0039E16704